MNKEFDVLHLIKSVRNLKIFMKNTLMYEKTKFYVKNSGMNVIDMDSPGPSENESQNSYLSESYI